MQVTSTHNKLGKVTFPAFHGERIYMLPFTKTAGLPQQARRWQPTVDQMLEGIETDNTLYLMVDEKVTQAGTTSRRGGVHVDGYWNPNTLGHGGHRGILAGEPIEAETLLLASNVTGCAFYEGEYTLPQWNSGDCSGIDVSKMTKILQDPNVVYGGHTLTMLHESIPVTSTTNRTVVRINVPGFIL